MRSSYRSVLSSLLLLTAFTGMSSVAWSAETETPGPEHARKAKQGLELFRTRVRQILTEKCLDCHGGKSTKADFDLSTRELLMDSGFVDKTADDSHLIALITHQAEPFMPLKADRLSDESIAVIRQWIDLGAPYDKPLVDRPGAEPAAMQVTDADREFWSFQPLNRDVEVPPVQNEKWARTPIDRFILARQEAAGLTPNAVADRRTLIRRGYLDLIGLPPTPEDIDAFVNDPRPLDVA